MSSVLLSPPGFYTVAIDDCALPEAGAKGWSTVAAGSVEAVRMEDAVRGLFSSRAVRIAEFHGSRFRPGAKASYTKFLEILKHTAENAPHGSIAAIVNMAGEDRYRSNDNWADARA